MWIKPKIKAELIGDGFWRLMEPVQYVYETSVITVHEGFETDFASIPRFYRWRFNPDDHEVAAAAVIHDALYASKILPRKTSDDIFRKAMKELGAGWWKRNVMYRAVRLGGGFMYSDLESTHEARRFITIE